MPSLTTNRFRKLRTCPAAETLQSFCAGSRGAARTGRVAAHVESCDFCGAEVQLLSRHAPPADALPSAAYPLPEHLRLLAMELLFGNFHGRSRLADPLLDRDRMILTDA